MKLKKIDRKYTTLGKKDLFKEIIATICLRKLRWSFTFLAFQVIAFLESGFIALLYFILDANKRSLAQNKVMAIVARFHDSSFLAEPRFVYLLFCGCFFFLCASMLTRYASEVNLLRLQHDLCLHYSKRITALYFHASLSIARKIGRERIVSSIIYDCRSMADSSRKLLEIAGAVCAFFVFITVACLLSAKMLGIAALVYVLPLWINRKGYRKIKNISSIKVTTQEELLSFYTDTLSGLERIKLDALETIVLEKAKEMVRKDWEWRTTQQKIKSKLRVSMDGLAFFGLLLVLFVGVVVFQEKMSILLVLFVIFNRIKTQVTIFSSSSMVLGEKIPHVYRYFELSKELEGKAISMEPEESLDFDCIEMKGVHFRYEEALVLKNIDFKAERGDRILIQGSSGHGKSTFLEVLTGLLTPTEGEVRIDGRLFDEILFHKIRHQIAYVSTEVYLFEDTLKNNLLLACPEKENALEQALALSGTDKLIHELPQGLDTHLGRNGNALSLGQRARVILARLYLKNPRLILLDEATANLDPALEEQIMQNLETHHPNAIVILVAHKAPKGIRFNKVFQMQRGVMSVGT